MFDHVVLMSLVHVDQNDQIALLHDPGEFSVGFEHSGLNQPL